jgi:hypothetical protein
VFDPGGSATPICPLASVPCGPSGGPTREPAGQLCPTFAVCDDPGSGLPCRMRRGSCNEAEAGS